MGYDIPKQLNASHDKRVKAALQQIDGFPPHVVFWNVPRLRDRGWGWAPSTFLGENTQVSLSWPPLAPLQKKGLLITSDGWRLRCHRAAAKQLLKKSGDAMLTIQADIAIDEQPFRRSWQRTHFPCPTGQTQRAVQIPPSGEIALIVDEARAVLVIVDEEEDGVMYSTFARSAVRAPEEAAANNPALMVSAVGTWVSDQKWYIG